MGNNRPKNATLKKPPRDLKKPKKEGGQTLGEKNEKETLPGQKRANDGL